MSVEILSQDTPHQPVKNSDLIILVDKPLDFTSADIVRILKKTLSLKKLGHSGTLDPKATGLLILCSDKMTKKINEFIEYDKEYEGIIRLGAVTKSFDTEDEEEDIADEISVSEEDIEKVRQIFLGVTDQLPPMYSAVKHKGRPLYKMARKGREIERSTRKINITHFEIRKINDRELFFRISCSKGTYIRVIANDFGKYLGTGGYLKELRRTRIGHFVLEDFDESVKDIRYKILDQTTGSL